VHQRLPQVLIAAVAGKTDEGSAPAQCSVDVDVGIDQVAGMADGIGINLRKMMAMLASP
jgi:hypothetical protein